MPDLNAAFIGQPQAKAHVASQILIYDQLVIPTHDYGVVAALINWLGKEIFQAAVESDAFRFVRTMDLLGYAGNGVGISGYTILEGDSAKPMQWWQIALFKEPERAIAAQIEKFCPLVLHSEVPRLVQRILRHCSLSHYDNETFKQHIAREAYREIQRSEELSNLVRASVGVREPPTDLQRLPGLTANQMRMGIRENGRDAINLVLCVAEVHRDLVMAADYPTADLYVPRGSERLLAQKIARLKLGTVATEGFSKVLDLNGLPDVEAAVSCGRLQLIDLWRLRQSKEAGEFRRWLRIASPEDARALERLYVSALASQPWISSTQARVLRFAITTAAGALGPLGSFIASAVDTFFAERWLRGYSPKLLFDRYRDLFKL